VPIFADCIYGDYVSGLNGRFHSLSGLAVSSTGKTNPSSKGATLLTSLQNFHRIYGWSGKIASELTGRSASALQIRFLHDPDKAEGYVASALSSTLVRFFKKDDDTWDTQVGRPFLLSNLWHRKALHCSTMAPFISFFGF
jgi:hypothetical protein